MGLLNTSNYETSLYIRTSQESILNNMGLYSYSKQRDKLSRLKNALKTHNSNVT